LSRAQLIEKYDILGEIERSKKVTVVQEKEKNNIDLYIADTRGNRSEKLIIFGFFFSIFEEFWIFLPNIDLNLKTIF